MYATTAKEAIQDVAIITGTQLIQSTPVMTLFDSGSAHMFIAKTFVDRIGLYLED